MTKGRVALPFAFDNADDEQQVPPLRFASVGMTAQLSGLVFCGWGLLADFGQGSAIPDGDGYAAESG